ncbi:hypothetical protein PQR57_26235 [Paraburkholderia dipogonis]|jgi:hypothetical protein|uniref:Beta-lactamase-related domain-containing protein n=1 Tax=Paraburkholderia dipogonis TaxID=1211383 RepID=A0ABW9AV97_9BURK
MRSQSRAAIPSIAKSARLPAYGSFDDSAIKASLDDVSRKALFGIAAMVVDRSGPLFHHAAGEAGQHTMFRNASNPSRLGISGTN